MLSPWKMHRTLTECILMQAEKDYLSETTKICFFSAEEATEQAKKAEAWDEIEKSVIASVADDVIVGVKGLQATITIVKKFA